MKLTDYPLLTDENIDAAVVSWLRRAGFNVRDVVEDKLIGTSDRDLLALAVSEGRVVVTHDSDFGTLGNSTFVAAKSSKFEVTSRDVRMS